jgi:toxin CcdB
MAQFDMHRLDDGLLVVDLQTDLIGLDATRLVAPLRDPERHVAFPGLTPRVTVQGRHWIVRVQEMAAVPSGVLGPATGSLRSERDALKRAIDILIDGV